MVWYLQKFWRKKIEFFKTIESYNALYHLPGNLINPLWLIWTKRIYINFLSLLSYSSYVKCGLKCFRFLSNIKIEKIENFDFLKNLQKNVKWILSHSIGIMTKYNWWIPMRIKIMTITLLLKILEKKIEFLEIGPFRKMAKTFFSIKDIN